MNPIEDWAGWLSRRWSSPAQADLPDAIACDPLSHPVLSRMSPNELADLPFPRMRRDNERPGRADACGTPR